MEDAKIIALIEGYQANTLSDEETIAFFQWYNEAGMDEFQRIYAQSNLQPHTLIVNPSMPNDFRQQLEEAIRDYEQQQEVRTLPFFHRYRLAWAAAILLFIGVGAWLFYQNRQPASPAVVTNGQAPNEVPPGTTKAVLTLADGRKVIIDSVQTGQLAVQGKTTVQRENGFISYNGNGQGKTQGASSVLYNILTTNRGEQSPPLVLADGTKVWLNALSSIRFPVAFTGNTRNVEITGEAYFEVASLVRPAGGEQKKIPFIVKILTPSGDGGEVEVLGTHFNINAYSDEPDIRTTLLEGSVKVVKRETSNDPGLSREQTAKGNEFAVVLKPGEQAVLASHSPFTTHHSPLTIDHSPDADQAVAWKRGIFDFNHASLQTVLRQLSRWYNIDVRFEGSVVNRTFRGKITRDLSLDQVINILQDLDVKFRIEGKTLLVSP
jgi:ferric-dicitrate binding protein FerR (iron transport regulator)